MLGILSNICKMGLSGLDAWYFVKHLQDGAFGFGCLVFCKTFARWVLQQKHTHDLTMIAMRCFRVGCLAFCKPFARWPLDQPYATSVANKKVALSALGEQM
jgi:hypothetical protein